MLHENLFLLHISYLRYMFFIFAVYFCFYITWYYSFVENCYVFHLILTFIFSLFMYEVVVM